MRSYKMFIAQTMTDDVGPSLVVANSTNVLHPFVPEEKRLRRPRGSRNAINPRGGRHSCDLYN
jgi:hypothetical protein